MLISDTNPCGVHVIELHLHGFWSRMFQFEKKGGGGETGEFVCSHEKSIEAS